MNLQDCAYRLHVNIGGYRERFRVKRYARTILVANLNAATEKEFRWQFGVPCRQTSDVITWSDLALLFNRGSGIGVSELYLIGIMLFAHRHGR